MTTKQHLTMLEKTRRLIEYSRILTDGIDSLSSPWLVAEENQGSTILNRPTISGPQVVVTFPLSKLSGSCDQMTGDHAIIICVVEKAKPITSTQSSENEQYLALLVFLQRILDKVASDISNCKSELCGLEIIAVEITPEANIFGGWNGWTANVTMT